MSAATSCSRLSRGIIGVVATLLTSAFAPVTLWDRVLGNLSRELVAVSLQDRSAQRRACPHGRQALLMPVGRRYDAQTGLLFGFFSRSCYEAGSGVAASSCIAPGGYTAPQRATLAAKFLNHFDRRPGFPRQSSPSDALRCRSVGPQCDRCRCPSRFEPRCTCAQPDEHGDKVRGQRQERERPDADTHRQVLE
jgi:hypothetical protein